MSHPGLFIQALHYSDSPDTPDWVFKVPAFAALSRGGLRLRAPVTILSGENAVGKSTLLEAIATACGFDLEGGPFNNHPKRYADPLATAVRAQLGRRRMDGYFLRAELHFRLGTEAKTNAPRGYHLHEMSHGESVMHVVQELFHAQGLFLLDEPESGLSFVRQMTLLAELHQIAAAGAQIIMVTHSPILLALPGADLWEISADGRIETGLKVDETRAFSAWRRFGDSLAH